ncbi:hypothetical protein [Mesobacillus subterraneus]|uniref:hypothetical protein n=1 Tax=Mesobacillus subterraneus TaxID=285983 RepID=UPI0014765EED|nr:hypothetical protein [Mesobacillus subterraneus]
MSKLTGLRTTSGGGAVEMSEVGRTSDKIRWRSSGNVRRGQNFGQNLVQEQ